MSVQILRTAFPPFYLLLGTLRAKVGSPAERHLRGAGSSPLHCVIQGPRLLHPTALTPRSWGSSPTLRGPHATQEVHEPDRGKQAAVIFTTLSLKHSLRFHSECRRQAAVASAAPESPLARRNQVFSFHRSVVNLLKSVPSPLKLQEL